MNSLEKVSQQGVFIQA